MNGRIARAGLAVALAASFVLRAPPAAAQSGSSQFCVTRIQPTPWMPAPNWWANPADHEGAQSLFDSAWSGASKYHFTFGTDPHVTFRAGHQPDPANPANRDLFLQWIVWVDPLAVDAGSGVWVLFSTNPDGAGAFDALGIHLLIDPSTTGGPNNVNVDQVVYKSAGGTSNWQAIAAPPAWIAATARQFRNASPAGPGAYAWGISVKIPVRAGQTFSNPATGIPPFQRMVYQVEVKGAPQGTDPGHDIFYVWPAGSSTAASAPTAPEPYWPDSWGAVQLDAACPAVSLAVTDIGASRPPNPGEDPATLPLGGEISRTAPTMFHARPWNNTGQAAPQLTARFRLADWGSQPGTFNTPGDGWKDLAELQQSWNPGGVTPATTVDIPTGQRGEINQIAGPPSAAWLANHHPHQCLYVELLGKGGGAPVLLSPDSAWRNFQIAPASEWKGKARLSIAGLSRTRDGRRDLYLYLVPTAMPKTPADRAPPPIRRADILPVQDQRAELELRATGRLIRRPDNPREPRKILAPIQMKPIELRRRLIVPLPSHSLDRIGLPTYQVHVYHDTGLRVRGPRGDEVRVLAPQGSFGYTVTHAGDLEQTLWAQLSELDGADGRRLVRVSDHFYRFTLDDGGSADLTTRILAQDPAHPYLAPGFSVAAAGLVAIGVGAVFAKVSDADLQQYGPGTPESDPLRVDRARTMGLTAGVMIGAGTLSVVVGALLVRYTRLTPPSLTATGTGLALRF